MVEMADLAMFDSAVSLTVGAPVCGIDEAGRGPLAGAVFAAAVVFSDGFSLPGVNDSKKLSAKKREALFDSICDVALSFSIATASVAEIEELNILNASMLAMRRAYDGLSLCPPLILIDGTTVRYFDALPVRTVVKGDSISQSIAAASILAKVSRDRAMLALDKLYPQYGFAKHKGYGTAAHIAAILEHGPCPEHRSLFLRKICGGEAL